MYEGLIQLLISLLSTRESLPAELPSSREVLGDWKGPRWKAPNEVAWGLECSSFKGTLKSWMVSSNEGEMQKRANCSIHLQEGELHG